MVQEVVGSSPIIHPTYEKRSFRHLPETPFFIAHHWIDLLWKNFENNYVKTKSFDIKLPLGDNSKYHFSTFVKILYTPSTIFWTRLIHNINLIAV